ncbi:hypothetical protein TRVL_05968 [Trypanosoma vivax]|nr:hypothetical protein TRVL_05968 [Trypanosoma vivax]
MASRTGKLRKRQKWIAFRWYHLCQLKKPLGAKMSVAGGMVGNVAVCRDGCLFHCTSSDGCSSGKGTCTMTLTAESRLKGPSTFLFYYVVRMQFRNDDTPSLSTRCSPFPNRTRRDHSQNLSMHT